MATLTNSYQYLGRSNVMTSTNGKISYYLLLYGKTSSNRDTGIHRVSIKSVLATTTSGSSYYLYRQEYNGRIAGTLAFSGTSNPDNAWELSSFAEDGVTYKLGTLLGEDSVDVDCSNGVAKDITLSCYYKFKSSNAATYTPATNATATVTVNVTLPAIARGATLLSAQNFSDKDNPTITYSNPVGTAVTSLQAGIYDSTGYIAYVGYREISKTGTSYTFPLTDAERATLISACGNSNSVAVKFYIKTKIGGTDYLANPIEKEFSINNADPIITASVIDVNEATVALTGDNTKLIKGFSNAQATMSAEAQKGAAINEDLYIIRNVTDLPYGDFVGYGKTHTFKNVAYNEFVFSAEDSRGNIGELTLTPTMIEYINPTCYISGCTLDGSGSLTVEYKGSYFNGSFGAVSNSITVQCRYRTATSSVYSDWIDMSATSGVNNYFASVDIGGLDYQTSYYVQARATDKLTFGISKEYTAKGIPVFHWGENDFKFEVPVDIKGDLRLKGDGNYGNTLRFGDGNYCYISEPEDDVMTIKASRINLEASGVYVDDTPIPIVTHDVWTPSLLSSAVSSYTTQYGWYSKVNQTVTVGFYIKANCYSGYGSTVISISGLPYTPMFPAAGGGMCSNATVGAGLNFQCFVAETTGSITTRVQSCNHTTQTLLITSASGCWYPSTGGVLTLSGTITYRSNS